MNGDLTEEEEREARKFAEIAARAEARAAARAAERQSAIARAAAPSPSHMTKSFVSAGNKTGMPPGGSGTVRSTAAPQDASALAAAMPKPKFLTKKQREELAQQSLDQKNAELESKKLELASSHKTFLAKKMVTKSSSNSSGGGGGGGGSQNRDDKKNDGQNLIKKEQDAIRESYLGSKLQSKRVKQVKVEGQKKSKKSSFVFEWDASDDTAGDDVNDIYNNSIAVKPLFGRGSVAGMDGQTHREDFMSALKRKRLEEGMAEEDFVQSMKKGPVSAASLRLTTRYNLEDTAVPQHWSAKALEDMTVRDWRIFREDFDIRIQRGADVLPIRNWEEAQLPEPLMRAINHVGYEKPSPIQRQAIPVGLQNRDLIGIAETGSGKTAAFTLPLIAYLLNLPEKHSSRTADEGPLALVMAPTRELAQQIEEEVIRLVTFTSFRTLCIVGGQSIQDQSCELRKGIDIVVGTPGRLVDCIENSFLLLNQCYYVVLDEADRMVDMGFEPQLNAVLDAIGGELKPDDPDRIDQAVVMNTSGTGPRFRVTAMFSATMPPEVERMAKSYLRQPIIVKIGDESSGKNKRIEQQVIFSTEKAKRGKVLDFLRAARSDDKIIVFANTKRTVDVLARALESARLRVGVLHGGKSQDQREETLDNFRSGRCNILVATDVAARGLDIPDVMLVINHDMAKNIETYTHRIGRTGRAGRHGVAITLITEADHENFADLKEYLEATSSIVPDQLARAVKKAGGGGGRDLL